MFNSRAGGWRRHGATRENRSLCKQCSSFYIYEVRNELQSIEPMPTVVGNAISHEEGSFCCCWAY